MGIQWEWSLVMMHVDERLCLRGTIPGKGMFPTCL